jgi:hypothetical protein
VKLSILNGSSHLHPSKKPTNPAMAEIIYDPEFHYCVISLEDHLKESLGQPLDLPEELQSLLEEDWLESSSSEVLGHLKELTGKQYTIAYRDNSCNYETDLDRFFVYTIFSPSDSQDWAWQDDCFVSVEVGQPGDPRYVGYSPARIYRCGGTIAESEFLTWKLSWRASTIGCGAGKMTQREIDSINERFSYGYPHIPTSTVVDSCYDTPIWSEEHCGYLARVKGSPSPVVLTPSHPF